MASIISTTRIPTDLKLSLTEFLQQFVINANFAVGQNDQCRKYGTIPQKLSVGRLYYFTQAITDDLVITQEGLYIYKSTGFVFLG
ncbi:MAG: hypothetical protein DRJ15_10745 [Bacteroidetes bacterium]|nr:MAG: hypothetical protein DRJ15_10745 [Bacteroidota bacterium]